jgi:hypothetical protein
MEENKLKESGGNQVRGFEILVGKRRSLLQFHLHELKYYKNGYNTTMKYNI